MAATLDGRKVELKYLFVAMFSDGSRIVQTPEDQSMLSPERSAFYDVLEKIKAGGSLLSFAITNGKFAYCVDLTDGHFEIQCDIDGEWTRIPFMPQPVTSNCIPAGGVYTLVYFRDHQQDYIFSSWNNKEPEIGEHRMAYRFGWEYEIAGRKWQQTLVVE